LSRHAIERATALLDVSPGDVAIVHVVQPTVLVTPVSGGPISPLAVDAELAEESNQVAVDDAHRELAATVRDLALTGATTQVVIGDPGTELCVLAEQGSFDVIVVGSHGSGFLKRVLLGSVSHHVLQHAPCPVLVVPGKDEESDE
jgi:nucleotide-binding universal stress UspA family protein